MGIYWALCSVLLAISGVCWASECSETRSTATSLSFGSLRNNTGHWIVTAKALREDVTNDSRSGEVWVDLEHRTTDCQGSHTAQITATATIPTQRVVKDQAVSVNSPPVGYERAVGLGYYKMHLDAVTWLRASDICVSEGAHLVIINSEKEAELIKTLHAQNKTNIEHSEYSGQYLHVGIYDLLNEGEFISVLGEPLASTGYAKWLSGQPDEGKRANCVMLNQQGELHDEQCTRKLAFICEYNL